MKKELVGRGALERLISLIKTSKQDKTDDSLKTKDKTIAGAINEIAQKTVEKKPAIQGLYTIYGKRKIASEGEQFPEFEDGSECTFRGAYYPNSKESFEQGSRRVVMWGKKGTFSVDMAEDRGEEPEDKHVTNRKFLADNLASMKTDIESKTAAKYREQYKPTTAGANYFYRAFKKADGSYLQDAVQSTVSPKQYTLVERDVNGRAKMNDPVDDLDIANKQFVKKSITKRYRHVITLRFYVLGDSDHSFEAEFGVVSSLPDLRAFYNDDAHLNCYNIYETGNMHYFNGVVLNEYDENGDVSDAYYITGWSEYDGAFVTNSPWWSHGCLNLLEPGIITEYSVEEI